VDDGTDSEFLVFSLSITPIVCYSEVSEWFLDMDATYHVCPKRERFASFEKLDGGFVSFGDGHHAILKE